MTIKVLNQANLSIERLKELQGEVSTQQNLKDVMKWALSEPDSFTPKVVADVIVQDEFSHDVLVPWREDFVLAYGTT